jgi:hypothetical protein
MPSSCLVLYEGEFGCFCGACPFAVFGDDADVLDKLEERVAHGGKANLSGSWASPVTTEVSSRSWSHKVAAQVSSTSKQHKSAAQFSSTSKQHKFAVQVSSRAIAQMNE